MVARAELAFLLADSMAGQGIALCNSADRRFPQGTTSSRPHPNLTRWFLGFPFVIRPTTTPT